MERPEEVNLSRKDGEALLERLQGDALTTQDRRVLAQVLRWYFWLLFALQEARFSLKRLRAMVFGDRVKKRPQTPASGGVSERGGGAGGPETAPAEGPGSQAAGEQPRPGHGRQGAEAQVGAERVLCRHEELAVGERCPVCGRGRLQRVEPGVEMRLDGHALLSAVRYALEKFRCSACGQGFTAATPAEAGAEKYSGRARAVLVLSRYDLGVPLYRLAGYQAMVGVPVSDATQWEQIERGADCAYPVLEHLKGIAAQGEVISQDDTHVRIVSLIAATRHAHVEGTPVARTGMDTTALVAQHGAQTICLSCAGRAPAGEHLAALLMQREEDRGKPIVMSEAFAANAAEEGALIRCHCLAHGRRKFSELEEVFPEECAVVIEALTQGFDHEEEARRQQRSAEARLAYHHHSRGPIMDRLTHGMDQQWAERTVEPTSSLGKARAYLRGHGQTLPRFLQMTGAPLDNKTVERALQLAIRQRNNSLFQATEYSAYIASLLTSLIATCLHAGVNALEYLVALQEHRTAVLRAPAAWLPWNSHATLVPP